MHQFQLVTTDGDALGPINLGRPDWPDGSVIVRGDEPNLRVVGRLEFEHDSGDVERSPVLVVEESG